MFVEFNDNLRTGNKMIDTQHEEWIGKINELLQACDTNAEKSVAVKTLNYLADYTDFHFKAEEKLQEEIGYPDLEKHKEQHIAFRKTVEELHEMLQEEEGPSKAFVEQVNKKIVEWLYGHIQGFDRSVAEYKNLRNNAELI